MSISSERPSVGRIYNYLVGGHHNFPVDRQAADQLVKMMPIGKKFAQLNRWFLQLIAARWAEEGISRVLDLGSGLPTAGHFNEHLPNAQILFTDRDPLSVTQGVELLKGRPNHSYALVDMTHTEALIDLASAFFGAARRLAVGCIGISYFLPDAILRELAQRLFHFCEPGSVMGLSYPSVPGGYAAGSRMDEAKRLYQQLTGAEIFFRTAEDLAPLLHPWKIVEARPLVDWLDVKDYITEEEQGGIDYFFNGALLVR